MDPEADKDDEEGKENEADYKEEKSQDKGNDEEEDEGGERMEKVLRRETGRKR